MSEDAPPAEETDPQDGPPDGTDPVPDRDGSGRDADSGRDPDPGTDPDSDGDPDSGEDTPGRDARAVGTDEATGDGPTGDRPAAGTPTVGPPPGYGPAGPDDGETDPDDGEAADAGGASGPTTGEADDAPTGGVDDDTTDDPHHGRSRGTDAEGPRDADGEASGEAGTAPFDPAALGLADLDPTAIDSTGASAVAGEESPEALGPAEVEGVFGVLEAAVETLQGERLDRLLAVLEAALAEGSGADRETVAELVAMFERLLVEPDEVDDRELAETLSVVEEALDGVERGEQPSLFGPGIGDPTAFEETLSAAAEATGLADLVPGTDDDAAHRLARVATATTRRATGQSVESGLRTGTRMAHAAATGESPADLLARTRAVALDELRRAGVDVGEDNEAWLEDREEAVAAEAVGRESLRERGRRLLEESATVARPDAPHPAFRSILDELRPDEARILRVLATEGPQPRLEVHDRGYVPVGSRPVDRCLTMLGSDAGCRRPERVPSYLENLRRLGLVTTPDDPVEDLKRYRVLEAQSHVELARERTTWPKSVYGSVRLTDLGVEFCETCFPFAVAVDPPGVELRVAGEQARLETAADDGDDGGGDEDQETDEP